MGGVCHRSPSKINLSDGDYIKKYIDSWLKSENITKIARIFKEIRKNNNILKNEEVQNISNKNIIINDNKLKWYLIFRKDENNHYLTEQAKEYLDNLKNYVNCLNNEYVI